MRKHARADHRLGGASRIRDEARCREVALAAWDRGAGTGQLESGFRGPSKEPSLRGGACISYPRSSAQTRHPRP
jgi:hypothetical protein